MPNKVDEIDERIAALDDVEQCSMEKAAQILGVHRVTLLRMEQAGKIDPAQWSRKPQPHRVYDKKALRAIKAKMDEIAQAKLEKLGGMEFVD